MTEFKRPERRPLRDIARERADAAIARIEQTQTLTEDEKAFAHAHELIHVKCEREWADGKVYEPAQPVHLPRYVKKGRDARPSRNPFADNSVRKHKR